MATLVIVSVPTSIEIPEGASDFDAPAGITILDKQVSGDGEWLQSDTGPIYGPVNQTLRVNVCPNLVEGVSDAQIMWGLDPDDPGYDDRDGQDELYPLRTKMGVKKIWGERCSQGMKLDIYCAGPIDPAVTTFEDWALLIAGENNPYTGIQYTGFDGGGSILYQRQDRTDGSESFEVCTSTFGPRQMMVKAGPFTSVYAEDITNPNYGRLKIFFTTDTFPAYTAPGDWLRQVKEDGREVFPPMCITAVYPDAFPGVQAVEVRLGVDSATWLLRTNVGGTDSFYRVTPAIMIVANLGDQDTETPNDSGLLIDVCEGGIFQAGDNNVGGTYFGLQVKPHYERVAFFAARVKGPAVIHHCLFRANFQNMGGAMREACNIYAGDVRRMGDGCPPSIDSSYDLAAERMVRQIGTVSDNPTIGNPAYPRLGIDFMHNGQISVGSKGQKASSLIVRRGIDVRKCSNAAFGPFRVYDNCLLYHMGGHIILQADDGVIHWWTKGGKSRLFCDLTFGHPQFIGTLPNIRNGWPAAISITDFGALIEAMQDPDSLSLTWNKALEPAGYED